MTPQVELNIRGGIREHVREHPAKDVAEAVGRLKHGEHVPRESVLAGLMTESMRFSLVCIPEYVLDEVSCIEPKISGRCPLLVLYGRSVEVHEGSGGRMNAESVSGAEEDGHR